MEVVMGVLRLPNIRVVWTDNHMLISRSLLLIRRLRAIVMRSDCRHVGVAARLQVLLQVVGGRLVERRVGGIVGYTGPGLVYMVLLGSGAFIATCSLPSICFARGSIPGVLGGLAWSRRRALDFSIRPHIYPGNIAS